MGELSQLWQGFFTSLLMQWKLDETYHHPIIDTRKWQINTPRQWPLKTPTESLEISFIEYRRRRFISEALSACEAFDVDLLVLPEYSVRPDTIKWLKDQLKRKKLSFSVLAGTYKMHGNISDTNFAEIHHEILGVSDHLKTFSTEPLPSTTSPTHSSGEHSSIITLLAPLSLADGERIVCTFSRRKKYPALAASETFSPLLESIKPLFSTENLFEELRRRDAKGRRVTSGISVSPREIINYSKKMQKLETLAEFICSELFLPMSPVNYKALAAELRKLAIRFGATLSQEGSMCQVIEDITEMSDYLSASSEKYKRRSIILVPAMTSRSADYWIFGQAALLTGGATTIFCNAVVERASIGGSCFIGRNSWGSSDSSPHSDNITPYAGWSKGIFYNQASDALGQKEQAMVIADIDPTFMQEGKPRPQALAVPLQLVAYLPIIENSSSDSKFSSELLKIMDKVKSSWQSNFIKEIEQLITMELDEDSKKSFKARLRHWESHWRANPVAGVPPAAIDWLWVDINSEEGSAIFVPKCK